MTGFIFFFILMLLIGIGGFVGTFWTKRFKRQIENLPTSTARAIAIGPAEVKGKVAFADKKLRTLVGDVECVRYTVKLEEYIRRKEGGRWYIIATREDMVPFYVEDTTGRVLVDPSKGIIDVISHHTEKEYVDMNEEYLQTLLAKFGITTQKTRIDRQLRCIEEWLSAGDTVYALGYAARRTDAPPSAIGAENLVLRKERGAFLYITDRTERGSLEWLGNPMRELIMTSIFICTAVAGIIADVQGSILGVIISGQLLTVLILARIFTAKTRESPKTTSEKMTKPQ